MPTYTANFRQRACLALKAAGYPDQYGALIRTAQLLNVSRHTLKRWYHQAPPPNPVQIALPPMLIHEVQQLFVALDHKRDTATYAQLSRALTQLVDALHQVDSPD